MCKADVIWVIYMSFVFTAIDGIKPDILLVTYQDQLHLQYYRNSVGLCQSLFIEKILVADRTSACGKMSWMLFVNTSRTVYFDKQVDHMGSIYFPKQVNCMGSSSIRYNLKSFSTPNFFLEISRSK